MDRRGFAVALGAMAGATVRWSVDEVFGPPDAWPWATFLVNLVGCLLLGFLAFREWQAPRRDLLLRFGLGVGFCGALTTFSTFAVEVAQFLEDDRFGFALSYTLASLAAGVALAVVGHHLRGERR